MDRDVTKPEGPRPRRRPTVRVLLAVGFLGVVWLGARGDLFEQKSVRDYPSRPLGPQPEPVLLPPPPVDDEYFPCVDCHEDEVADPRVRELDEHDEIELAHGDLWCLDCHQDEQRDLLHLSDASPVEMSESWRLCTRCHAKKIPDWRAGVHGKRTGYWWGPKEYQTCVVCHDPHSPLFKSLEPKPPPLPAGEIKLPDVAGLIEVDDERH
jgi:hypothetical protein